MKEVMLEAMSNILRRKRQERMVEQEKVDEILKNARFPKKETPKRGYLDRLEQLNAEIKKLEEVIGDVSSDK